MKAVSFYDIGKSSEISCIIKTQLSGSFTILDFQ